MSNATNCPDLRNSRVIDVIQELRSYGVEVHVHDPVPSAEEAEHEYGLVLETWEQLPRADAIIVAVAHKEFLARSFIDYRAKVVTGGCFVDVKAKFDRAEIAGAGLIGWRL